MRFLRRLGNPVASEAAAFRWLLAVGAAAIAIAVVALVVRAIV